MKHRRHSILPGRRVVADGIHETREGHLMAMKWNRRSVMGAALAAAVPVSAGLVVGAEEKSATAVKGKLTDQALGTLLKAIGLDAKVQEQRYDFAFKATIEDPADLIADLEQALG